MRTYQSTLLAGMVTLLGGTLLFCFGRNFGVYIVARFLQGISSAVVWIVGFILFDLYSL
jgi:predicted MFS family arabinose efflux permease